MGRIREKVFLKIDKSMFYLRTQIVEETQQDCVGKKTKHSGENFLINLILKLYIIGADFKLR